MEILPMTLAEVSALHRQIPEMHQPASEQDYQDRIGQQVYFANGVKIGDKWVGFKLGYQVDDETFYSWLGGVLPLYRGQGIAKALLHHQEAWVKQQGYQWLRVKSMNRFPMMMQMLLSQGYHICDFEGMGDIERAKIHFQKRIQS